MRRRPVLVIVMLSLAVACAAPVAQPRVAPSGPAPAPTPSAQAPFATFPPPPAGYADPTRPALFPTPVAIPADSYAPEPVVELGTVEIPAIGLEHRLYQGVTLHNIDRGPSHWTGTAMPGKPGNAVIAGHRSTETEPFRHIDALVPGDTVIFTVDGSRSTYRVTGHLVVTPADTWIADQTTEPTATLYACHPLGSTAERYVVRLSLVAT